jgi:hypothetical protein
MLAALLWEEAQTVRAHKLSDDGVLTDTTVAGSESWTDKIEQEPPRWPPLARFLFILGASSLCWIVPVTLIYLVVARL